MSLQSHTSPENSTLLSTVYQNKGRDIQYRKLVYATDYHFQDIGVAQAEVLLVKQLEQDNISIQFFWDRDNSVFVLTCHWTETGKVCSHFHQVLRKIIHNEEGEKTDEGPESDSSEDELDDKDEEAEGEEGDITIRSDKIIPISRLRQLFDIQGSTELAEAALTKYPSSVEKYKIRQSWKCDALFDQIASEQNLRDIGCLTRSELARDAGFAIVYIGSDSQEDCNLALKKLNTILHYSSVPILDKHVFYSEEIENFKLSLRAIGDCKKRLFETTLLDNFNHWLSASLHQKIITKMAILDFKKNLYVPFKEAKYHAATEARAELLRYWKDFTYEAQGAIDPLLRFSRGQNRNGSLENSSNCSSVEPLEAREKAAEQAVFIATQEWVQDLPEIPKLQASVNKPPKSADSWDSYTEYGENGCIRIPHVEVMPFKGLSKKTSQLSKPPFQGTVRQAQLPRGGGENSQSAILQIPSIPIIPIPATHVTRLSGVSAGACQPLVVFSRPQEQPLSFLDDDLPPELSQYPSLLQSLPGQGAFLVQIRGASQIPASRSIINQEAPLIDFGDDKFVQELQQGISEVSTRAFHTTMNQKAPRTTRSGHRTQKILPKFSNRLQTQNSPKPRAISGAADPTSEFHLQMESAFLALMGNVRGYRGSVVVQAVFGRIFLSNLPPQYIERKDADSSLCPEFVINLLRQDTASCFFTRVLTLVPQDIHYMIDLEEDSQRIWEATPVEWNVLYEFYFKLGLSQETFTIEMKAGSLQYEIKQAERLGSINTHGIKRRWDFVVQILGSPASSDYETKYGELAKAIQTSLFVPQGLRNPQILFEIPSSLEKKYKLGALRVHRICKFRNTASAGSILKVSEIYDLDIDSITASPGFELFKATACTTPRSPSEKLSSWFEVAIICPILDKALQENKSLELGEEASWAPEEILEMSDKIYHPACQVLKQIDGVGFHNWNDLKMPSVPNTTPSPASKNGFW